MNRMARFACFALVVGAVLGVSAVGGARAQQGERCFAETGVCISGAIRAFWEQNGGLAVFGLPLSAQEQQTADGKTVQAQWFERARLELHPENQPPYHVLLGRLGNDRLIQQGRDWFTFPKSEPQPGCRFFPETGHNICGPILAAWRASGLEFDGRRGVSEAESLALFGMPLSDPKPELIEGREYTVQWFERARFELHPENRPPYHVLLGRLGAELRAGSARYALPGSAVFPEGIAYQPSTGHFYVSATGDGTIFRGSLREPSAQVFLPGGGDGRAAAVGMKVDDRGRLFIAGGNSGNAFVYSTADGRLIAKLSNGRSPTLLNDVAVTPGGDAFFTDTLNPVLFRVAAGPGGELAIEGWLDFSGLAGATPNGTNGIAASADGAYLIFIQSNTGKLFRVEVASKRVDEINVGGAALSFGDGILLEGQTLYVVRNRQGEIVKLQLAPDLLSGSLVSVTTDPLLAFPTTAARAGDRLLVVNSQFDKRGPGLQPSLPFTVASIPLP